MRLIVGACLAAVVCATVTDARSLRWQPDPGIYTNEEEVYFEVEAGREAPPWIGLKISKVDNDTYIFQSTDRFGRPLEDANWVSQLHDTASGGIAGKDILIRDFPIGKIRKNITLRRARPTSCWVAIRKDRPKADGKEDWHFSRDVKLHDQGGRARAGGDNSGAQEVVIRMRNVIWPPNKDGTPSTNRPSIVLYVHKPDQPDRAESYVWADPGAARIGINLRWMQASCTIDGAEKASEVTPSTFRG
jgi:hypothetical protein